MFESLMESRSAAVYADFLLPYLGDGFLVLDVGCGTGSITVGMAAEKVGVRFVGVDPNDDFGAAREHSAERGIENVEFRVGDV